MCLIIFDAKQQENCQYLHSLNSIDETALRYVYHGKHRGYSGLSDQRRLVLARTIAAQILA